MSQENVKKFYLAVVQDPAMKEQILTAPDRPSLVSTAVKLGKEKGYSFAEQDVDDWLTASANQSRPDGLSDIDSESVAGGKEGLDASHAGELAGGLAGSAGGAAAAAAGVICAYPAAPHSQAVTQAAVYCG
jgi:predicted ribosomally synthesized peptide with nif11-like leader